MELIATLSVPGQLKVEEPEEAVVEHEAKHKEKSSRSEEAQVNRHRRLPLKD